MKKTITVATTPVEFPSGTTFGGIKVTVFNSIDGKIEASGNAPSAPYEVIFDLPAGDYISTYQAIDAESNNLGEAATGESFTILPEVTIDIPVSVS